MLLEMTITNDKTGETCSQTSEWTEQMLNNLFDARDMQQLNDGLTVGAPVDAAQTMMATFKKADGGAA